MRFSLTIDCDNAAFQPEREDASASEIVRATTSELARIMEHAADAMRRNHPSERAGQLRDTNGNRCGAWSLSEEEERTGETLDAMLARHAQELVEAFPERAAEVERLLQTFPAPAGWTHAETSTDANQAHADYFAAQQEADARAEEEGEPSALALLWAEVKAHDERMSDFYADGGARPPTADDYNALFAMVKRAAGA